MEITIDDNEILKLARDNMSYDKAIALLYEKYKEDIYYNIRRFVVFHDDADDIFQNTMIKIFRFLPSFEQKASLKTWIYTVTVNESLSYIKATSKKFSLDNGIVKLQFSEKLKSDPYFEGNDIQMKLITAIALLPERQRLIFNMKYFEDLTFKELAEILSMNEGGVKSTYHIAYKKIKEHILSHD